MNGDTKFYDVVIVGTGIAGLSSAVKLAEEGLSVAVITRAEKPEESNTFWAQGGIIFLQENDHHIAEDIQKASSNTSFGPAIDILQKESAQYLKEILIDKAHTPFTKSKEGKLCFTQEAAHSEPRIIYNTDATGKSIEISLLNYVSQLKNVDILTSRTALDLITPSHHGMTIQERYEENQVVGVYVFSQKDNCVEKFIAKKIILATGGFSALYHHHTNSEGARGDGIAMAKRAGAVLLNMEHIQFHPTTFFSRSHHRRFLISEAVRGEGGVLYNEKGERFMDRYHPDGELAPRDVVSHAIVNEMLENKDDCVYLDISHKDPNWLQDRFPNINNYLKDYKIDFTSSAIPVVPAAHYTCGGIKVNLDGQSSIKNLYAVGEVSCTGLHGVNRLASTSLLEGLTWGYRAGTHIARELKEKPRDFYDNHKIKNWVLASDELDLGLVSQDKMIVRQTMWNYVGINRSRNRLLRAQAMFRELYLQVQKFYRHTQPHDELIGLRNSIEVAFAVLSSSLRN